MSKNDILEPPPRRLRPLDVERSNQTIAQGEEKVYNHEQNSWNTFAFLGRFLIHTEVQPLPLLLTNNIRRVYPECFFPVSTLYRVGEGDTLFYEGTQK